MSTGNAKKFAAVEAAKLIQNGMIIGIGTGSTVAFFIDEIGRRVHEENLEIKAVTTSSATTIQARNLGIPLLDIDKVDEIDLTIDGADEVDTAFDGIKGGGAALLMEKIVAVNSREYVWIVDESKCVTQLGKFPLPVEVIKYGAERLFKKFVIAGYKPTWREKSPNTRFETDQEHFIIDLHLGKIIDVSKLAFTLDTTVGVVEHGLFLGLAQQVIVGYDNGEIKVLKKSLS